ncbi:GNAT family N-acetyltransferase [Mesorhizobium sp. YM1C-6-2]|uniref:GNAT family N-acetyltransferase n=1 Tax=Mesorhizobium sp. YM1C-6-2 TaxID=1827501 RepID=UPI000EF1950C|nr:GNAT family N-acetyltransferase [Mesorhizobium sp. YM1C-6-2]RLP22617.1 GNAT family N-acetyltransferase [Mesorhizobium sp. YM1C-6-2]
MVELLVTYMEALSPPPYAPLPKPIEDAEVRRAFPDRASYLDLYAAIGKPLQWDQRLRMPPADLETLLALPSSFVFVLMLQGKSVGMCEFNGVGNADVELMHFGLVPEAQGRRLGPFLLDWSLRRIWAEGAKRIWLHTDTNDHARAQSVYGRAGFAVFDRRLETFPD